MTHDLRRFLLDCGGVSRALRPSPPSPRVRAVLTATAARRAVLAEQSHSAGGDDAIVAVDDRRLPELHPLTYMHRLSRGAKPPIANRPEEARVVLDAHDDLAPLD